MSSHTERFTVERITINSARADRKELEGLYVYVVWDWHPANGYYGLIVSEPFTTEIAAQVERNKIDRNLSDDPTRGDRPNARNTEGWSQI